MDNVQNLLQSFNDMNAKVNMIKMLPRTWVDVNMKIDKNDRSSLMWASLSGHVEDVITLAVKGAQVDLQDVRGLTALIMASLIGHLSVVYMLLANNAHVDLQDKEGQTALMLASHNGHVKVVEMLLLAGAKIELQDKVGCTARMWATMNGHTEIMSMLSVAAQCDEAFVNYFSEALQQKYGSEGVTIQTVKPFLEATAMSQMLRVEAPFLVADPVSYARAAMATIGIEKEMDECLSHVTKATDGCLSHILKDNNTGKVPRFIIARMLLYVGAHIKKELAIEED